MRRGTTTGALETHGSLAGESEHESDQVHTARRGHWSVTTASQVAAAALLSTVAGAVINADTNKAGDYVTGIGSMAALLGVGVLAGVRDEVKMAPVRMAGLGLFGMAIGAAIPFAVDSARSLPSRLGNSIEHRERSSDQPSATPLLASLRRESVDVS